MARFGLLKTISPPMSVLIRGGKTRMRTWQKRPMSTKARKHLRGGIVLGLLVGVAAQSFLAGAVRGQIPTVQWARQTISRGTTEGLALAVDSNGNCYVT